MAMELDGVFSGMGVRGDESDGENVVDLSAVEIVERSESETAFSLERSE